MEAQASVPKRRSSTYIIVNQLRPTLLQITTNFYFYFYPLLVGHMKSRGCVGARTNLGSEFVTTRERR
jgi:hypothetical protein